MDPISPTSSTFQITYIPYKLWNHTTLPDVSGKIYCFQNSKLRSFIPPGLSRTHLRLMRSFFGVV